MSSNRPSKEVTVCATHVTAARTVASKHFIVSGRCMSKAVLALLFVSGNAVHAAALHGASHASQQVTEADVPALVREAVAYQLEDFQHSTWGLRYQVHRADGKDNSVRDLVESTDGNVARTLQRNGQPLTAEETEAEKIRLRAITPDDMAKRRHGSSSSDKYGVELLQAMPTAMIYTLAAGQPQLQHFAPNQIVLDFTPNPGFRPANTAQTVLPGLAGRLWLDGETHRVSRIELHVIRNVNVIMGLLIRVYPGGLLVYEQRPAGGGHYAYSHIEIDVRLRELMVRTVPYHSTFDATDVQYLPTAPSLKDAVAMLLNDPGKPRP